MVSMMFLGTGQTRSIVNDLAREMQIDPELSRQLAAVSRSTQPYLYAVSPPVCPGKQSSAKYDYVEATPEQKPIKTNAKPVKPGRAPQPLPHQHLIAKESLGLDPNFRRPLSLNDLRPPPTSPPPPLPKNGRLTLLGTGYLSFTHCRE